MFHVKHPLYRPPVEAFPQLGLISEKQLGRVPAVLILRAVHRKDHALTPIFPPTNVVRRRFYPQQLMEEFGATQDQLAKRIGRSRPQISNTIRLLKLPALVQRRVAAGVLSAGHARALLMLTDQAQIETLAQKIVNEGLSVRAVEELVAAASGAEDKKQRKEPRPQKHRERLDYIADAFADKLDTSVKISLGARKGKMTIEFANVDDLNRIIKTLDTNFEN